MLFTEISTEMLNETKNVGQESTGQEGKCQIQTEQEIQKSQEYREQREHESDQQHRECIGTEAVEGHGSSRRHPKQSRTQK